ncbi:betaine/proline/choline family ABC transporter ATP-binding protein [Phycicoccus endophyticus]|uniref:ABC-type quaternary amine transporter n=1 Tax=Phycicoccus endophyticus TaxID=1690220 RepID=A0A7G9R070_9MICO|nr:betaine/proline/choline family ABC transporter ATP-binding protein [Phycicoccus endophyticus]NHI20209.1 betaine/proline/choline family ABC transporter ATP-binding protein [Phycicoccus endophyticus]QNN48995.1 betaine/proline/choline family ABC transporter ATP-binding protein [Phycicoccus endophyticus]GGL44393.1 putative ABC transporter, ATP-binding protein [Phycicoccus endophyticus]
MSHDAKIRLEEVEKRYLGTKTPAVASLSLEVKEGEILVLVGPSGCGKSTTLRLINRMIEPTGGRIILDDEDVTKVNPDALRRRIGYVIQQIGLFPHQTIAQNIATVPKMLGWDKARIGERVDELLSVVGLDPETYRDRYPKELSGGQAQRVGVARALGADPEIMLMDEPFGAIDPITRDRLQNEFLRVQETLRKTIVFVTHDVDEAIKMGDRIAILGDQSHIRQIDTPERILAFPVDDFVADFIGSGSTLKGLHFEVVDDNVDLDPYPTMTVGDDPAEALERAHAVHATWVLVLDDEQRPLRWVSTEELGQGTPVTAESGTEVLAKVQLGATLFEALEQMLISEAAVAVVVREDGSYYGVVRLTYLNQQIRRARLEAREHYERMEASS